MLKKVPAEERAKEPANQLAIDVLYEAIDKKSVQRLTQLLRHWDYPGTVLEEALAFWQKNDYQTLQLMLAHGLSPDAVIPQGERLMASFCGDVPIAVEPINLLLDHGADVNLPARKEAPLILFLCGKADEEQIGWMDRPYFHSAKELAGLDGLLKRALESGADPNAVDDYDRTPLYYAALWRLPATLERLLSAGADPNRPDRSGTFPIQRAVGRRREEPVSLEVCSLLIKAGCDLSVLDRFGNSLVGLAFLAGQERVADLLIGRGAQPAAADFPMIAQHGTIGTIRRLLKQGLSVNAADGQGETALLRAASEGRTELVRGLLALGADVHQADNNGRTALLNAVRNGNEAAIDMLIGAGSDLGHLDKYGSTAFEIAAAAHRANILRKFPKPYRARLGPDGSTPLMIAMHAVPTISDPFPALETVRCLLQSGSAVNAVNSEGNSALMLLVGTTDVNAYRQHSEALDAVAELLIRSGADVHLVNAKGLTALHAAAKYGFEKIVNMLLAAGADATVQDSAGRTPLDYAVQGGHASTAIQLRRPGSASETKPSSRKE